MYVWSLLFNNKPFILWVVQDVDFFYKQPCNCAFVRAWKIVSWSTLKREDGLDLENWKQTELKSAWC